MNEIDSEINMQHQKRNRHRKKQLYSNILRQMEFYFSDANLTKDRFLSQITKENECVPLDIFLKFNKIRAITDNVPDICKALKNSTILEVLDDTKVKRKLPVQPYNVDERTVYVESIPVTASIEWINSVFEQYGPVAYISMPKFKNTQRIKGYAFIEFTNAEDANKCLAAFTEMGCKLPISMAPEELSTIKLFSVEDNIPSDINLGTIKKIDETHEEYCVQSLEKESSNSENVGNMTNPNQSKDDQILISCSDKDEPPEKKQKVLKNNIKGKHNKVVTFDDHETAEDSFEELSKRTIDNSSTNTGKRLEATEIKEEKCVFENRNDIDTENNIKKDVKHNPSSECSKKGDSKMGEEKERNKVRKRNAKERLKSKQNGGKSETPKGAAWGLQVLSKKEWKALRNKYLNLQRKHMIELKQTLRSKSSAMQAERSTHVFKEHNFKPAETKMENANGRSKCPEQVPGILVLVKLDEPCFTISKTKKLVRSNIHVQHVDIKEGQRNMVVRFDSADSAAQYAKSGVFEDAQVLTGAEEAQQWEAIRAEWSARASGVRVARGRDRLVQRATQAAQASHLITTTPPAKHIRFDE